MEKYQWPDAAAVKFEISPRSQTRVNDASSSCPTFRLSWDTVQIGSDGSEDGAGGVKTKVMGLFCPQLTMTRQNDEISGLTGHQITHCLNKVLQVIEIKQFFYSNRIE